MNDGLWSCALCFRTHFDRGGAVECCSDEWPEEDDR